MGFQVFPPIFLAIVLVSSFCKESEFIASDVRRQNHSISNLYILNSETAHASTDRFVYGKDEDRVLPHKDQKCQRLVFNDTFQHAILDFEFSISISLFFNIKKENVPRRKKFLVLLDSSSQPYLEVQIYGTLVCIISENTNFGCFDCVNDEERIIDFEIRREDISAFVDGVFVDGVFAFNLTIPEGFKDDLYMVFEGSDSAIGVLSLGDCGRSFGDHPAASNTGSSIPNNTASPEIRPGQMTGRAFASGLPSRRTVVAVVEDGDDSGQSGTRNTDYLLLLLLLVLPHFFLCWLPSLCACFMLNCLISVLLGNVLVVCKFPEKSYPRLFLPLPVSLCLFLLIFALNPIMSVLITFLSLLIIPFWCFVYPFLFLLLSIFIPLFPVLISPQLFPHFFLLFRIFRKIFSQTTSTVTLPDSGGGNDIISEGKGSSESNWSSLMFFEKGEKQHYEGIERSYHTTLDDVHERLVIGYLDEALEQNQKDGMLQPLGKLAKLYYLKGDCWRRSSNEETFKVLNNGVKPTWERMNQIKKEEVVKMFLLSISWNEKHIKNGREGMSSKLVRKMHYELGNCYRREEGTYEKAIFHFEKCNNNYALAELHLKLGNNSKALEHATKHGLSDDHMLMIKIRLKMDNDHSSLTGPSQETFDRAREMHKKGGSCLSSLQKLIQLYTEALEQNEKDGILTKRCDLAKLHYKRARLFESMVLFWNWKTYVSEEDKLKYSNSKIEVEACAEDDFRLGLDYSNRYEQPKFCKFPGKTLTNMGKTRCTFGRGKILMKQKRYQDAISLFETFRNDPYIKLRSTGKGWEEPLALYYISCALLETNGSLDKALQYVDLGIEIMNPPSHGYKQQFEKIKKIRLTILRKMRYCDGNDTEEEEVFEELEIWFGDFPQIEPSREVLECEMLEFGFSCGTPSINIPKSRLCPYCEDLCMRSSRSNFPDLIYGCKHTRCSSCRKWFCHICLRVPVPSTNLPQCYTTEDNTLVPWPCGEGPSEAYAKCPPVFEESMLFPAQTETNRNKWKIEEDKTSGGEIRIEIAEE